MTTLKRPAASEIPIRVFLTLIIGAVLLLLASAWGNPQPAQIASGAILGSIISMMFIAGSHFGQLPPGSTPILPVAGASAPTTGAPEPLVIEVGIDESVEMAFDRYQRVANDTILFDGTGRMFSNNDPAQELQLRLSRSNVSELFANQ